MPLGPKDLQLDPHKVDPPSDETVFEIFCCDLAKEIWHDPTTQRIGRRGQNQNGIDVRGIDEAGQLTGIQCRKKDLYLGGKITGQNIKDVVEDAKNNNPPLKRLIIATTLPRDARLQDIALKIRMEHREQNLFSVEIWSWDEIKDFLDKAPDTFNHYYSQYAPGSGTEPWLEKLDKIDKTTSALLGAKSVGDEDQIESETVITQPSPEVTGILEKTEGIGSKDDDTLSLEIDKARDLIDNNNPNTALETLEAIKKRYWSKASDFNKFRILTNIAVTKIEMRDEEEGARMFIEALQYNKTDEKALCNAALGYTLVGDLKEAKKLIRRVIEENKNNKQAYSLLVYSLAPTSSVESIIKKIPKVLINDPDIAYSIGNVAKEKGNKEESKKWFEIASGGNSKNKSVINAALAQTLLKEVVDDPTPILIGHLKQGSKEKLEKVVNLYDQAWGAIAQTEISKFNTSWIVNRALANKILGNSKKAIKDLELALELDPGNPEYLKQKAFWAYEEGNIDEAIAILEPIVNEALIPEAGLMLAGFYREKKIFSRAVEILESYIEKELESKMIEDAKRLLVQLYIETGQTVKAKDFSDAMIKDNPQDILSYIDRARIYGAKGDSDKAIVSLREAKSLITKKTGDREVFELAEQFYRFEKYEESAELFEKVVDYTENSKPLRQLVNSYYNSGKLKEALEICQKLYQQFGPLEFITEMESSIYEEMGDLDKAKVVCEAFLEKFPTNKEVQIRLAVVNYRLGNQVALNVFLDSSLDISTLSLLSKLQVTNLFEVSGRHEEALKMAYEVKRDHFSESDAHVNYVTTFLRQEKNLETIFEKEKVEIDTAITVEYQGGEKETYILEERADPNLQKAEINIEHPLTVSLIGKKMGDIVCLRKGELDEKTLKVIEIKSKYVHSFQESLSSFGKILPPTDAIQSIYVEDRKDGKLPVGLEKILDQASKMQERQQMIEKLYKEKKLTVGAVAQMMGKDIFIAWSVLTSKPDLGIQASLGTKEERIIALEVLRGGKKPKLIIDIISLLTIHELEIADKIVESFGRLGVSRAVVDLLLSTAQDRRGINKKGYTTIGKEGDRFVKEEITPDQVKKNLDYIQTILEWVERNCDILPCEKAIENPKKNKRFREVLGESFLETLLIASEDGHVLYSDDEVLRGVAKSEYGTGGVWTQLLLMVLVGGESITQEEFAKATVKLVSMNYKFTSINKEALTYAGQRADWKNEGVFFSILQRLKEGNSEEDSAINVALEFIVFCWRNELVPEEKKRDLIGILLQVLVEERDRDIVLSKFKRAVKNESNLAPLEKEKILADLRKWNKKG